MWRKTRLHSIYSGFPQAKDSAVPANRPNLSFDVDRLSSTLESTAEIGPGLQGGPRRLALPDSDKEMRDQFVKWCVGAGCAVSATCWRDHAQPRT